MPRVRADWVAIMRTRHLLAGFSFLLLPATPMTASEWRELFNGRDLDGWTVTLEGKPEGEDPDKLVQVRDGMIHMYADTDPELKVPFGVITHEGTFSRFHLTLEYRWLEKRFAPRKEALRDAGLLYHASATDKIWPDSLEYQIQEGDSADIVFLGRHGWTWAHPEPGKAPEGQGKAGMLPERGGIVTHSRQGNYLGRYPEHDHLKGWNRVDVVVHADESAEHFLNGHTRARLVDFSHPDGSPLKSGKICLQLEGAELQYRGVRIRELAEPLRADRPQVALSAVKDQPARDGIIVVNNPRDTKLAAGLSVVGADADAFSVHAPSVELESGASMEVTVRFRPVRGAGRYSAGLRIGSPEEGTFVVLQGVGLAAFEGKNEPTLQSIVHALGIPVDVGGTALELDTKAPVIGGGVAAPYFRKAGDGPVRVTALARFSPRAVTPFGFVRKGTTDLVEAGKLADSSGRADAHQSLFPPVVDDVRSFDPGDADFAFYMKAHQYTSFTDPALPTEAKIAHTARIYPATRLLGRNLEHAYLVGFEEAANGDYQDALFLLENVEPAP